MCCRYWAEESPELREIVEEMNRSPLVRKWQKKTGLKTYGEIRPTDVVPVIAPNRSGDRAVFPMKWGVSGKSLLMNARSETAGVKPTFKESWERRRCIIPASWYFEWEHLRGNDGKTRTGDKYMIQPKDSPMTWLCGLYRIEEGLPVFVVLTREPGEEIRFIHDRMPLILPEKYIDAWIRPDTKPEELLPAAMTDMVFEKAE
jgi:putative SOS response-associated peptidase YedK